MLRGRSGQPGIIDQMERGHPRIAAFVDELTQTIAATVPEFVAPVFATPEEERFAALAQELFVADVAVDVDADRYGWAELAEHLSSYHRHGHYLAARRWVDAPDAERRPLGVADRRRVELFHVHPSTVSHYEWGTTPSTVPVRVRQQTPSYGSIAIDWQDVLHLQCGGVMGEVEGVSIYRPLVFIFERWKSIALADERSAWLASGTMLVKMPAGGESAADASAMRDTLVEWASGYSPWLAHPDGYDVRVEYPSGTPPDVRDRLEYLDEQIDQRLSRAIRSLASASHGSRALGESVAEQDSYEHASRIETLYARYGRACCRWLAGEIGYTGRLPLLAPVEDVSVDADVAIDRLVSAVGAGLIAVDPSIQRFVRETLSLPDAAVPVTASDPCCGTLHLAESDDGVIVVGADGREFAAWRPLNGPELDVAWATDEDDRGEIVGRAERKIQSIAERHRAATWAALADGWQPGEQASLYDRFVVEYEAALAESRQSAIASMRGRVEREIDRAMSRPMPSASAGGTAIATQQARRELARSAAEVRVEAETIASRVQSEVESDWSGGARASGWSSRITPAGLAAGARSIVSSVESQGRTAIAAEVMPPGVGVTAKIRTSIPDGARCDVCHRKDGTVIRLPEDAALLEQNPLPDPKCRGGRKKCRCGWLNVYGRTAEQMETEIRR